MNNSIHRGNPNFLHPLTSPMQRAASFAHTMGNTMNHWAHTAHSFAAMAHAYSPPNLHNTLMNTYIRPYVNQAFAPVTRPLAQLQSTLNHAAYQTNYALTRPFAQAQYAVTHPIAQAQQQVNNAFNHAIHTVSHPFVQAQHVVSSPVTYGQSMMNNTFGHVFSRINNLQNHIASRLGSICSGRW